MRLTRRATLLLMVLLSAAQAVAQMPTTPTRDDPARTPAAAIDDAPQALKPLAPEHYTRQHVAPDMLSASIEALNAQTHAAAYRAALSEIREHLVKMRMSALILMYKQQIIADAQADLGLEDVPQHHTDAQFRIHLHALKRHGIELRLPELPPGRHASGLPMTPGSRLRQETGLQP
jgi:hypothetical protein